MASQTFSFAALERPWSEKWIDFSPREGPGAALGGHFGSCWEVGPAGTKKRQEKSQDALFFGAVFACVFLPLPCVFCSPRRSAARKHYLKNASNHWFLRYNLRVRRLRAEREHPSNRKKVEQQIVQMQAKNTMPRKLEKRPKKHCFGSPNVSKNRPPRPPGAPWPPPARDFRAKSSLKALFKASSGGKNSKGAPGRNFQRDWQKTGIGRASVGGVGAARKSLSWPIKARQGPSSTIEGEKKGIQTSLKNEALGLHFGSNLDAKIAPGVSGALLATSWAH